MSRKQRIDEMTFNLRFGRMRPAAFAKAFEESEGDYRTRDVMSAAAENAGALWLQLYMSLLSLEG